MAAQQPHIPVLLKEATQALGIAEKGEQQVVVDCTFGAGGHTREILTKYPKVQVIAIDRDESALATAKQMQEEFRERLLFFSDLFSNVSGVITKAGFNKVNALLYDFGFSSMQMDNPLRGFSFQAEGKLNMQMGMNKINAFDVVNFYPEEKLANIIFHYGDERYSRRIARAIVRRREEKSIETTTELESIIYATIPPAAKGHNKTHPATKSFQAIRIEVNNELAEIKNSLQNSLQNLSIGGRLCIISFHSLEDKVVKEFIRSSNKTNENIFERNNPSTWHEKDHNRPILTEVSKVFPSKEEIEHNPRARSAKLRVIEKIGEP